MIYYTISAKLKYKQPRVIDAEGNEECVNFIDCSTNEIIGKAEDFNTRFGKDGYIFYVQPRGRAVTIAAGFMPRLIDGPDHVRSIAEQFVEETTGYTISDADVCEIGNDRMLRHIRQACRYDYVPEPDKLDTYLRITSMRDSVEEELRYSERLSAISTKRSIQSCASKQFCAPSLGAELERIFSRRMPRAGTFAHPVHYMLFSDSRDVSDTVNVLAEALHLQKRVGSRRVVMMELGSGISPHINPGILSEALDGLEDGIAVIRFRPAEASEGEYASSDRRYIEMLAGAVAAHRHNVLFILCFPQDGDKPAQWVREALPDLYFVRIADEPIPAGQALICLRGMAQKQGVKPDAALGRELKPGELYTAAQVDRMYKDWFDRDYTHSLFPQYAGLEQAKTTAAKEPPKGCAFDELNEMIGLDRAKDVIRQAVDCFKAQKLFADRGLGCDRPSMSMVFTGNPGTAKTSVARLFARILAENGILKKGQLVEVGRGDLVGKYVGWTAQTVQSRFAEAKGGVLFIDEAYSLLDDRGGSFGDEAINTIVQEMENHREDTVVIFAGYPKPMEAFLSRNPGLRSRVAFHVGFDDYDVDELCRIAALIAGKKGLTLSADAVERLTDVFDAARLDPAFDNGRFARSVIEKAKMKHAARLVRSPDVTALTDREITTLTAEDIDLPEKPARKTARVMQIGFSA